MSALNARISDYIERLDTEAKLLAYVKTATPWTILFPAMWNQNEMSYTQLFSKDNPPIYSALYVGKPEEDGKYYTKGA